MISLHEKQKHSHSWAATRAEAFEGASLTLTHTVCQTVSEDLQAIAIKEVHEKERRSKLRMSAHTKNTDFLSQHEFLGLIWKATSKKGVRQTDCHFELMHACVVSLHQSDFVFVSDQMSGRIIKRSVACNGKEIKQERLNGF